MRVQNKRPWPVEVAHKTFTATVEAGGTIDVPEPVGKSLIRQRDAWQEAPNKAKTASSKETK